VVERVVRIRNRRGLHARPATRLVELANRFRSDISIDGDEGPIDAKSVLNVLTLAATEGTDLRFVAEGDDAEEALEAIAALAEERFGTEDG
jgi:phosphotransferase system HPr (HPr) family protein